MRGNRDLIGNQVGFAFLDFQCFVFPKIWVKARVVIGIHLLVVIEARGH